MRGFHCFNFLKMEFFRIDLAFFGILFFEKTKTFHGFNSYTILLDVMFSEEVLAVNSRV